MYPEVRAAVEADAGPDLTAPGFDIAAHREEVRLANLRQPREDVASVADLDADGVRCRLYTPADALPGLVVHAHGGGFVLNDIDVHDGICRRFANRGRRAGAERRLPPPARGDVPGRARRPRHGGRLAAPRGPRPGRAVRRPRRLRRRQPRAGGGAPQPGLLRRRRARLPLPRPARRASRRGSRRRTRASTRPRPTGTGSSTPAARPTSTTPTSPRSSPTGCTPCRRPSSPPRSTTRCATRARSSPGCSPRPAWRPSASAASARPTASGATPTSPRPSRSCARWRAGSTSTSAAEPVAPAIALHFHPGWGYGAGDGARGDGRGRRYRSQWVTGTSNGGLTAAFRRVEPTRRPVRRLAAASGRPTCACDPRP